MRTKFTKKEILFAIVICVAIYIMVSSRKSGAGDASKSGDFTVYGTSWCGYTTKQRDALGDRHVYVDCDIDKDQCKGISSFPVTVNNATGEKHKGFNPNL